MNRVLAATLLLGFVGTALGVGFWLGQQKGVSGAQMAAASQTPTVGAQPSYFQHPDGEADYSPAPKKTADGRDYVPVYESDGTATVTAPKMAEPRRIKYYRHPMGLPDTSPVPKKDSMGMDYIPVYEGDEVDDGSTIKVNRAKVQKLGVRSEAVQMRALTRTVRAVGTVQMDERRLAVVTTKFEGWIEKLHVNTTGQAVRRGQPLMEIYSPGIVVAQQEYLIAWQALQDLRGVDAELRASAQRLIDGALAKLRNWDISEDQIRQLQKEGEARRRHAILAPADGIVLEKSAVEGMRFMPGEMLYKTADLSTVWLIAEVFEQDLALISEGQPVRITVNAYPGVTFSGTVEFIYPTLARETRTARVRIIVPNPDRRLRADMYASVELNANMGTGPVLAVPDSAVINSGTRQVVLVERGEGRYEPREVKIGAAGDGFYEIREGLKPDDRVVVSANFLLDAESNLRAALRSFTTPDSQGAAK